MIVFLLLCLIQRLLIVIGLVYSILYSINHGPAWIIYTNIILCILTIEIILDFYRIFIVGLLLILILTGLILSYIYAPDLPIILLCLGFISNGLALIFNRGTMPIVYILNRNLDECLKEGARFPFGYIQWHDIDIDHRHQFAGPDTKLFYLCDWIAIRNYFIISVGDIFILSSGFLVLGGMILRKYY